MIDPVLQKQLFDILHKDAWRMNILRAVCSLNLPDAWVGAGFVRAMVWDHLTNRTEPTHIDDIDVIYFNDQCVEKTAEKEFDKKLTAIMPNEEWSCKNQARMHLKFGVGIPYTSSEDGLHNWLETPTAVALRLDKKGTPHCLAPFGLEDLFSMRIAPTPFATNDKPDDYIHRVTTKPWKDQWPELEIIMPKKTAT